MKSLAFLLLGASVAISNAFWLMGMENILVTERLDPVVNPGTHSGHVHSVVGGSNFGPTVSTASLRDSTCTSTPIAEDNSNYWFPTLYFQWKNGSFTSLTPGVVIYYLYANDYGATTAFPDDFRMISGTPNLRTYNASDPAQQAVTFLCLDFSGTTTKSNGLPLTQCASGIRSQINFPACWNGINADSSDHKSHVAFLSGGPDTGTCADRNDEYNVTLPRIFIEAYWNSNDFNDDWDNAMNTTQPFVFSYGDRTGYGYHADFINGWKAGVLQNAVDSCTCPEYGDPTCCAEQGIFTYKQGQNCYISNGVNETVTGTLPKLPGNNPVQEEGTTATTYPDTSDVQLIEPVYVYTDSVEFASGNGMVQTGLATGSAAVATPAASSGSSAIAESTTAPAGTSVATSLSGSVGATAVTSSSAVAATTSVGTAASAAAKVASSASDGEFVAGASSASTSAAGNSSTCNSDKKRHGHHKRRVPRHLSH